MKEFERHREDLIKTQESIQLLSRAILPITKATDYAAEDSDNMARELSAWNAQVKISQEQIDMLYQRKMQNSASTWEAKVKALEQEVAAKKAQIRVQTHTNIQLQQKLSSLTKSIVGA